MSLKQYKAKRTFTKTPEPPAKVKRSQNAELQFAVQMHAASRLHFDFRLELDGVMLSWAVPKGPSLEPTERRLAVQVEDHPMDYRNFEGIIPKGNYGAGTVIVWDQGTYWATGFKDKPKDSIKALKKGLAAGDLKFCMDGTKLKGEFALVKIKKSDDKAWLLIKKRDGHHVNKAYVPDDISAMTGRSLAEVAESSLQRGDLWLPKKGRVKLSKAKVTMPKASKKINPKQIEQILKAAPTEEILSHIKLNHAKVANKLPAKQSYLFEPSWEGYQAIASANDGSVKLYSKGRVDFGKKFPKIRDAVAEIGRDIVLDGTIVFLNADGSPRQKGLGGTPSKQSDYAFYVSDILHLDGRKLSEFKLESRKEVLATLGFPAERGLVRVHPYFEEPFDVESSTNGAAHSLLIRSSKDPYYSKNWLKIRAANLASKFETSQPPPLRTPTKSKVNLTKPATVSFSGLKFTPTNTSKVFWPEEGYTKGDLLSYYYQVAPFMLPHIKDRPESLNRHPNGIDGKSFFQKEMTGHVPKWIKTKNVEHSSTGKTTGYAICQDVSSLLFIVNLGCIEINVWNARAQHIEKPDYVVFDLDPGNIPFAKTVEAALEVRKLLEKVGAKAFCKTTGGRGLHIYAPIHPKNTHDKVREFAEAVSRIVHAKLPSTTSIERNPALRSKLVYFDFLQNRRGQTMAAPYSVRPRPHALVSTPLDWREVTPKLNPDSFTMTSVLKRVKEKGDPWHDIYESAVDLKAFWKALRKLQK